MFFSKIIAKNSSYRKHGFYIGVIPLNDLLRGKLMETKIIIMLIMLNSIHDHGRQKLG